MPEVQLWKALRGGATENLHPVGRYILDFYAPSARLAVEVEGAAHDLSSHGRRDGARDAWLTERGIPVLRFNATDVLDTTRREDVLMTIAAGAAREAE